MWDIGCIAATTLLFILSIAYTIGCRFDVGAADPVMVQAPLFHPGQEGFPVGRFELPEDVAFSHVDQKPQQIDFPA